MKLTAELAQAMVNLRSNTDFQVFARALSDDGEQLVEKLVMMQEAPDVPLIRGEARRITLILKAISEAPKRLEEFKNQPKRGHN